MKGGEVVAIKMRNNTKADAVCCECGESQREVLNMFDLLVGNMCFTICDACNDKLFFKTLRASVARDSRVKSPHDLAIIRRRKHGRLQ